MKINQRGVTLITLIIMIIMIMIISGITVVTGTGIIKRANLQNINTNMLLIQAKAKTLSEQSKFNKNEDNLKGKIISEIKDNEKINKLLSSGIINSEDEYYLLSQEDLNSMGLEKIKIEDGYLVNYGNEEIIYLKGFEDKGNIYYKLSETKTLDIR